MASPTKKKKAVRKNKAAPNKANAKADAKRLNQNIEILARLSQA
jgi:hypothetical protein